MKNKQITVKKAGEFFRDGMTIMVGGFMGVGTPPRLMTELLESGVKELTIIANDTAFVDTGLGPLIVNGRVKKVIASHIGTNPETGRRMIAGEMEVQLIPQGTLAEQIRCGGAGWADSSPRPVSVRSWKKANRKLPSMAAIISSNFPSALTWR